MDTLLFEFFKGPTARSNEQGKTAHGIVKDVLDVGIKAVKESNLRGLQVATVLGKAVIVTADSIGRAVVQFSPQVADKIGLWINPIALLKGSSHQDFGRENREGKQCKEVCFHLGNSLFIM